MASEMEAAAKAFFSQTRFAVAGASADTKKFGYKIFAWYHEHSLPVTPLNPRLEAIELPSKTYRTAASPSKLEVPKQTGLSIVTPPKATLEILREAKTVGIPAVWLQPGTFNDEIADYARANFAAAVFGQDDYTLGHDGWCVLVDGERALAAAGVNWTMQKL